MNKKSVSNLDIYDLASITKIGATLPILMKMKEDKILSLDDSFSLYLDSIGNKDLVYTHCWPKINREYLVKDKYTLIIQVNGKVRCIINIGKNLEEEEIQNIALEVDNVSNNIGENQIKKVIYVKDKLINFVI